MEPPVKTHISQTLRRRACSALGRAVDPCQTRGGCQRQAQHCLGRPRQTRLNEHGITLRHGTHKGRLIRPTRYYGKANAGSEWPTHYTNAIYSDDGGKTWLTSEPFPAMGTGEATVAELSDGRVYYKIASDFLISTLKCRGIDDYIRKMTWHI